MDNKEKIETSNQEMVTISCAEYERLQAQGKKISELENRVEILMDALRLERHRQFGASSERISEDAMDQLSFLFNEAEVYCDVVKPQEEATPVVASSWAFTTSL